MTAYGGNVLTDDAEVNEAVFQATGVHRHRVHHYGRHVRSSGRIVLIHSATCMAEDTLLTDCVFSQALSEDVDMLAWKHVSNVPVVVTVQNGCVVPLLSGDSVSV